MKNSEFIKAASLKTITQSLRGGAKIKRVPEMLPRGQSYGPHAPMLGPSRVSAMNAPAAKTLPQGQSYGPFQRGVDTGATHGPSLREPGFLDSLYGSMKANPGKFMAGGLGGGYVVGSNRGYNRGHEHGHEAGYGQGYSGGFNTASSQAQNTGFLGRLMGNMDFDPSAGIMSMDAAREAQRGSRAGMLNRSGMYVPFFGG